MADKFITNIANRVTHGRLTLPVTLHLENCTVQGQLISYLAFEKIARKFFEERLNAREEGAPTPIDLEIGYLFSDMSDRDHVHLKDAVMFEQGHSVSMGLWRCPIAQIRSISLNPS